VSINIRLGKIWRRDARLTEAPACLPVRRFAMAGGYVAVPAKAGRTRRDRQAPTGDGGFAMLDTLAWTRTNFPSRLPRFARNSHSSLKTNLNEALAAPKQPTSTLTKFIST